MLILTARVVALYGMSDNQARAKLKAAHEAARRVAREAGFREFKAAWLGDGLDVMEGLRDKGKEFHWGVFVGTLRNFAREDGPTEREHKTESRALPAFDPEQILARLISHGWTLRPDGKGGIMRFACNELPCEWDKLPSDLREKMEVHRDKLIAYVLDQAKGVSNGPT